MPQSYQHRSSAKLTELLSLVEDEGNKDEESNWDSEQQIHAFANTPIFTVAVDKVINSMIPSSSLPSNISSASSILPDSSSSATKEVPESSVIPQYGLIGHLEDSADAGSLPEDRLVLANMNMPWSAFICGSQGAGKSHTLSCLLENALVADNPAGKLPHPLAGMVFHYDNYASHISAQICESAYLCSSGVPVTVLVSPSNIWVMKRLYENLPGLKPGVPKPKVLPLYLDENKLDIQSILKLMAVDPSATQPPLYMDIVMNIARELAMEGPGFAYSEFRRRLSKFSWLKGQQKPLNLRLQLLDTIIASSTVKSTRPAPSQENIWSFNSGTLTIVDLSDPFFNGNDACTIFSICLSIFLEERHKCGRVLVLDEAHKFLTQGGEAVTLTNDLLSVIRQQRHLGTRVLVATQEPTISSALIDLANVTFVHRFLSPNWYETLEKHLAGANNQAATDKESLFDKIVSLRTGEALMFCPTAQLGISKNLENGKDMVKVLGNGYAHIKIRKRLTEDGGKSIMATDSIGHDTTRVEFGDVPMHIAVPQQPIQGKRKEPAITPIENRIKEEESPVSTRAKKRRSKKASQQTQQKAKEPVKSVPKQMLHSHTAATRTQATLVTEVYNDRQSKLPLRGIFTPSSNDRKLPNVAINNQATLTSGVPDDRENKPPMKNISMSSSHGYTAMSIATSSQVAPVLGVHDFRETLRQELVKRAREMFQDDWSKLVPLTKAQFDKLYADIDRDFKCPAGSTEVAHFGEWFSVNEYLADLKAAHYKRG